MPAERQALARIRAAGGRVVVECGAHGRTWWLGDGTTIDGGLVGRLRGRGVLTAAGDGLFGDTPQTLELTDG